MKNIIYLPTPRHNPYWNDEARSGNALVTHKRERGLTDAILAIRKSRATGRVFTAQDIAARRARASTVRARRDVLVIVGALVYAKADCNEARAILELVTAPEPKKRATQRVSPILVDDSDLI